MIIATSWPDAAVAIAGIALVGAIVVIAVWQLLATWRARMSGSQELEYRKLADTATDAQQRTAVALEQVLGEMRTLTRQTGELERMISEVE